MTPAVHFCQQSYGKNTQIVLEMLQIPYETHTKKRLSLIRGSQQLKPLFLKDRAVQNLLHRQTILLKIFL